MFDTYLARVILIPTSVFLSVLFGASYGSGREVVEFVSSNGPTGGIVAILTLVAIHSVLLCLSFEICRLYRTYDYVSFFKVLLKKGWFLYEIVIIVGLIIALSITTSVGGTVIGDHFEFNTWFGTVAVLFLVVALTYFGREVVKRSMIFSVIALFAVLAILIFQLFDGHHTAIASTFENNPHQWTGLSTATTYAIGGGGYLPLLLYCARGLQTRSEAIVAGLAAASVAALPAVVFHMAFMTNYPAVINEQIPAYAMFEQVGTPLLLNIYVLVMFILVSQTGVGVMQGLIERVDNWSQQKYSQPLSKRGHALLAAGSLGICMAMGSMGIVSLILRGYTVMFASFVVVFVIPLVTYGTYLVMTAVDDQSSDQTS